VQAVYDDSVGGALAGMMRFLKETGRKERSLAAMIQFVSQNGAFAALRIIHLGKTLG